MMRSGMVSDVVLKRSRRGGAMRMVASEKARVLEKARLVVDLQTACVAAACGPSGAVRRVVECVRPVLGGGGGGGGGSCARPLPVCGAVRCSGFVAIGSLEGLRPASRPVLDVGPCSPGGMQGLCAV